MADKPKKQHKGLNKQENGNIQENPLLYVEDKVNFKITTGNLLQDPGMLIFKGYDVFDIKKDRDHFDFNKLDPNSQIIITLRYYEYVCIARFEFSYIIPILESGLDARETFDIVKHALRNKLFLNAPTFDTIFDIDIVYSGYVKY